MKKTFLLLIGMVVALSANATTPLWLRDVSISPDGQQILFCYKGDVYKVASTGGQAVQMTANASFDSNPIWSPDGRQIAFASDRYGSQDIFVMPSEGGQAVRLTAHSANEIPACFTPDGAEVLFTAAIQDQAESVLFPTGSLTELYSVPVTGGRTRQVLGVPAEMATFNADGSKLFFHDRKGFEDEWRKHHTSSITRDVWMYDVNAKSYTNLTNREGEDRNPVLSADGQTVFMLSERNGGNFNVYSFPIGQPENVKEVTRFPVHPVRFLSISRNDQLCYTFNGEIYTQERPTSAPKKVEISIVRDEMPQTENLQFTRGASSSVVSPDGKQVAFIVRGEVFVTSVDYATTKQITHTAAGESGLTFSADGRTLVYASERTGTWNLYKARIVRDEDPNFPNATLIEEEPILPSDEIERTAPDFSPDGKEIAFIEDRQVLKVLNLETKQVRQITDKSTWPSTDHRGFTYTWSPDGRWFAIEYIPNKHDPYYDIGLVSADGGQITNLTGSAYFNENPRFVLDGNAILFLSDRYGMRAHASWGSQNDAFLCFLNQDAYDRYRLSEEDYALLKEIEKKENKENKESKDSKGSKDSKESKNSKNSKGSKGSKDLKDSKDSKDTPKLINVELAGIEDRIVRLTPNSSDMGDAILSPDGESLYYQAAFEGGYDIWKLNLRKKETKLLNKTDGNMADMQLDKEGKNLFLLGSSQMQKLELPGEKLSSITFKAEMTLDLAAEREYMFNHVVRQEQKRFYNTAMHGVDWPAMAEAYRRYLPHINNRHDFAEMLSEILGELNVSHTGGRYRPGVPTDKATAELGLLFDWSYNGDGLLITEVIEKGPFSRAKSEAKSGCIVEKIDGQAITDSIDPSMLLVGKIGKKTLVSLRNPATGKAWDEVVLPISRGTLNSLLYNRWVKQRAADVERLSGGRLGYVHIESMDDDSFRTIYSDILGKYNEKEGIVIDTRFNGGGRLHEDIEILFSGEKYLTQEIRGQDACDMPSRRWNKPSIMLTAEANYSNAHGTPWVYKYKKIGKLVGMPVPGTMTSVSWETLQDPSLIFGIPVIGYRTAEGTYLENSQLEPDVKIANSPEKALAGEDEQLARAVDELLKQIDGKQ